MFGYNDREFISVFVDYDPAADDLIPLFRATQDCEVISAYAIITNNVNQTDSAYFTLAICNGGTAGTATTALSGTIGGTAGTPGWTGLKPEVLAISDGTVSAGELVTLSYDETSTATFGSMLIQLELLAGVGADA
jgi:hypothetical protein